MASLYMHRHATSRFWHLVAEDARGSVHECGSLAQANNEAQQPEKVTQGTQGPAVLVLRAANCFPLRVHPTASTHKGHGVQLEHPLGRRVLARRMHELLKLCQHVQP